MGLVKKQHLPHCKHTSGPVGISAKAGCDNFFAGASGAYFIGTEKGSWFVECTCATHYALRIAGECHDHVLTDQPFTDQVRSTSGERAGSFCGDREGLVASFNQASGTIKPSKDSLICTPFRSGLCAIVCARSELQANRCKLPGMGS